VKPPLFRFRLGRMMSLIAVCALLLAAMPPRMWPVVPAILIVIPGFVIDRIRGGPGIVGSMVAGSIGFACFGVAVCAYLSLSRQWNVFETPGPLVMILALGIAGLAWGTVVGFWTWMILGLLGVGIRPGPMPKESVGPIVWRGLDEPGRSNARAGGHVS
jgi:hypothetical protein